MIEGKLDPSNVTNIIPLTPLQAGILYEMQLTNKEDLYIEQLSITFEGELELNRFQVAWNYVIQNNEALRTVFRWEQLKSPIQIVLKENKILIQEISLMSEHIIDQQSELEQIRRRDLQTPIDITKSCHRMTVYRLNESVFEVIFTFHHIILDGWSTGIVINELLQAYKNQLSQPVIKAQFSSYIRHITNDNLIGKEVQKKYWQNYLHDYVSTAAFPNLNEGAKGKGKSQLEMIIPDHVIQQLKKITTKYHVTPAAVFYSVWGLLLQRFAGTKDVIFGTTISGRHIALNEVEEIAGLLINTLPLRIKTEGSMPFYSTIQSVGEQLKEREPFSNTPLYELTKWLNADKGEPLFESIIVIENYPLFMEEVQQTEELQVVSYNMHETTNVKIMVEILTFDQWKIRFLYDNSVLCDDTIELISKYFNCILEEVIYQPRNEVANLPLMNYTEADTNVQLAEKFIPEMLQDGVHKWIENCAAKYPDKIAFVCEESSLTYSQLNAKANKVASLLRQQGVGKEDIIAIHMERSSELMIYILAVIKANAAFLTLDTRLAVKRIEVMLNESGAKFLISSLSNFEEISFSGRRVTPFLEPELIKESSLNLDLPFHPNQLAYVFFTSGSTGRPKGILIEHHSLTNFISGFCEQVQFHNYFKIISITNVSFDPFITETLLPLSQGMTVIMATEEQCADPQLVNELIVKYEIEVIQSTPSRMISFLESSISTKALEYVKLILIGGESFPQALLNTLRTNTMARIYNIYGPTETTVWSSVMDVTERDVCIGPPIHNMTYMVFHPDYKWSLQPVGMIGEIYITGSGLARGYANRDDLTNLAYVTSPFKPGKRMYKTGDLGRLNVDGTIEFLGRRDSQVKIRGHRIELMEVEKVLNRISAIRQGIVMDQINIDGDTYLCAYVTLNLMGAETEEAIREQLLDYLPGYMIPEKIVVMDELPLNFNGKVDRSRLPKTIWTKPTSDEIDLPETVLQVNLINLWKEILNCEYLGIHDDFMRLGGHSLKAAALSNRLRNELHIHVPIQDIFNFPTISQLSTQIYRLQEQKKIQDVEEQVLQVRPEVRSRSVTPAQKRLFVIHQMEEFQTAYNLSVAYSIEGIVHHQLIEDAIKVLINRHDSLRASFEIENGEVYATYHNEVPFKLHSEHAEESDFESLFHAFQSSYDLQVPGLLRAKLLNFSNHKYGLMLEIHHIIADGTSISILMKEFIDLLQGKGLPSVPTPFSFFNQKQQEYWSSDQFQQDESYWLKLFEKSVPVLNLYTDEQRPLSPHYEGETYSFTIDDLYKKRLSGFSQSHRVTLYALLLSAFKILLHKYTDQSDIVVGMPVSGRVATEFDSTIGMFVNTLPVRSHLSNKVKVIDYIREVQTSIFSALEHQQYPLELLIDKLHLQFDRNRHPLFDTLFVMQNSDYEVVTLKELTLKKEPYYSKIAKFELAMEVLEQEKGLTFLLEYRTNLFNRDSIIRFTECYRELLGNMLDQYEVSLKELDFVPAEQREVVLNFLSPAIPDISNVCIHEKFESKAAKTPDAIAISYNDISYSYKELNHYANRLAWHFIDQGVNKGETVGIILDRSPLMWISIMAVLKSGCAYLPIQPDCPQDRLQFIVKDSGLTLIITQENYVDTINSLCQVINVSNYEQSYQEDLSHNLNIKMDPTELAYVIYTSGSTGVPKGVQVEHQNVMNILQEMNHLYPLTAQDAYLLKTTYTFDVSVMELFGWFSGDSGRLVILEEDGEKDPYYIYQMIEKHRVTHLNFVPSMLKVFVESIKNNSNKLNQHNLKYVFSAGEPLTSDIVQVFAQVFPDVCLENVYGPTESTIYATYYSLKGYANFNTNKIPIGRPFPSIYAYIVDSNNRIQPIGVPGELILGGAGVARGYIKRPELDDLKFSQNPYGKGRWYRTGDLARWTASGHIEYLGRMDTQVKLRGYRIELEEIESCIQQYKIVKKAVVTLREEEGVDPYLAAYVESTEEFSTVELTNYLRERLPAYMVPLSITIMERLPLMDSGKLNRNMLPQPVFTRDSLSQKYEQPVTDTELFLVRTWQELLPYSSNIGIDDSFFDLGGNSLRIVQMKERIEQQYPAKLTVADLFTHRTIRNISMFIDKQGDTEQKIELVSVRMPEHYFVRDIVGKSEYDSFFIQLTSEMVTELVNARKTVGYDENVIFTGVFSYLLSQLQTTSVIWLYLVETQGRFSGRKYDLSKIMSIEELFQYSHVLLNSPPAINILWRDLNKSFNRFQHEGATPLLTFESVPIHMLLRIFDFICYWEFTEDRVALHCHFDKNFLNRESMKELMLMYVRLLENAVIPKNN
ncbi:hypothetical protein BS614_26200 [Paenibacillus xylanexedens]|uniref:non-ribosomal peptide synthetase n=1 Tax=Paenibacillus xylanexedens TaxID=528191 RepID=UPI0009384251|nr:non-ribosomal peptide synthetase [Paenibacillus xylanexedens]APO47198.1 hypothetical protein BS614_26200 [Paenibacillus xylanexedens]